MAFVTGLRKIFHKRNMYDQPNRYRLTPRERESVGVFIAVMATVILTIGVTFMMS